MSRYISKLIPQCIFDATLAAHVEDASVRDFTAAALMQTQRATDHFLGAHTHVRASNQRMWNHFQGKENEVQGSEHDVAVRRKIRSCENRKRCSKAGCVICAFIVSKDSSIKKIDLTLVSEIIRDSKI